MRSNLDRLRHTLYYELLLLVICTPLLSYFLHQPAAKVGGIGVVLSLLAMIWNYAYNLAFDETLLGMGLPLYPRGFGIRMIHAVLFEIGFMTVTIPAVMWWINYTFWQALVLDAAFIVMVPIYTLIYNWGYDLIFPVPSGGVVRPHIRNWIILPGLPKYIELARARVLAVLVVLFPFQRRRQCNFSYLVFMTARFACDAERRLPIDHKPAFSLQIMDRLGGCRGGYTYTFCRLSH